LKPYFREARERRASDLHFVAERPPLLRLCGELLPSGPTLPASLVHAAAMEMIPARLHTRFEEEGTVDFSLTTEHFGRFRANVTRQRTGLKVCLRLIGETMPTLESLGLPESIRKATHHHQGLIVITGPTGHGKTTTLAALIDHINSTTSHHVITVEDPIEYVHSPKLSMMSQREVGTHTKTFRSALKASLREDPDVIVIGELRDTDTVRIALAASETGHLVLGTMNTPSASKTIDRLIDLFPPSDQQQVRLTLAGGLKLILSQRLVPTTDGTGSLAACEILPGSVPLWNLIRENKTFQIPSLQQRGKALGIVRLEEALADLVRQGKTTLERVRPFGDNVDELLAKPAAVPGAAAALGAPGTPLAGRATTAAPHDQTEETSPKSALLDLAKRKLGLKKES
jgi:twitching motility protein PilT